MKNRPVAVVTGASRGIGKAIALALAKIGFNIAGINVVDIEWMASGANIKAQWQQYTGTATEPEVEFQSFQADIADLNQHARVISEIKNRFGRMDVLVNNAGVAPLQRLDVLETTPESFDRVLGVNLRGTFFLTQRICNDMLAARQTLPDYRPRIIFITSISAEVSSPNRAEYCISKAGLSMVAKNFADRLANTGITVFEIRPGVILTDMTAPVKDKYDRLITDGLIPQSRWGYPEDVARAVVALAQGNFDFSTGMIFEVSGGMNIKHL